jgi:KipI family sensor histidine kinase inhibitor
MNVSRYGEDGIRIIFGDTIDLETNKTIRRYYFFLKSLHLQEIIDIIPSFRSCLIHFDRDLTSYQALFSLLTEKEKEVETIDAPEPATHEIPVLYGGEYGPDMEFVVEYSGLTKNEVIEIHTSTLYTVYTVGFIPGFPYLGTLDKRLYVPRLDTPRVKVPEGSVGLAQLQTGIYTFESPGGWRIIGNTNIKLFDYTKAPYSLLKIGDKVRFVRI